jgi:hypothetical protein
LLVGLANSGISGVRGVVRLVRLELPPGRDWKGLRLKTDLLGKGVDYPIRWACRELLNAGGSLTLKRNQYI